MVRDFAVGFETRVSWGGGGGRGGGGGGGGTWGGGEEGGGREGVREGDGGWGLVGTFFGHCVEG